MIVFLFLNSWRSTIITGLTLPISIIGTMSAIYFLGYTLNIMTMMALTLAIGMLIDDAIVVRENITRHLAMGKSHVQAALEGTQEIGLAVVATTLTIVAVFLPVAFMDGIIGRFFLQFGVTISVAVLISLFVAFTLDPMLSSAWYDPATDPDAPKGRIWRTVHLFDKGFERLTNGYTRLLAWCLRWRKTTLLLACLSFLASFTLVSKVGFEFLPAGDGTQVEITLETPPESSIEHTQQKALQAEALLRQTPEFVQSYTTVAGGMGGGQSNTASITAQLTPTDARTRSASDIAAAWRASLDRIPGATFSVSATSNGPGGGQAPVSISVTGPAIPQVTAIAQTLQEKLRAIPGLIDVKTDADNERALLAITLDPRAAAQYTLSQADVGAALRIFLEGQSAGEWTNAQGQSHDIYLQGPPTLRESSADLLSIPVGRTGQVRPLHDVATLTPDTTPSQIQRKNAQRSMTITAQLEKATLGDVSPSIDDAIAAVELPPGYTISQGGDQRDLQDSGRSAATALGLAIAFIYLILASQFGSFLQPVAIMASLPLSLVGVLLGLLLGGSTINMYSMIGFIMLMGLVVKNAILLVDNANQKVAEGLPLPAALQEAGHTRLRPIVMTTLAMIMGMLPMALNLSGGSGENAPMAHAVIGGLISSSLLTLVVVPIALIYTDAAGKKIRSFFPKAPSAHT